MLTAASPISLEALDERAALLRRVDRKYVVDLDTLARLIERLGDGHDVLEIDGRRRFAYDAVYIDTEDLRCFRDHAEDVKPRFKARTRCYVDAGDCVFEVKVKRRDGETDKRQTGETAARQELLETTLRDAGIDPPGELEEVLRTRFRPRDARRPRGRCAPDHRPRRHPRHAGRRVGAAARRARARGDQERGRREPADRALADLDAREVSISKYRTGVDALLRRDETGEVAEARALFV